MKSIDFSKYKRFFAFGCSFTAHIYPTWANIIFNEIPNAEFYNFGLSGAGNLLISGRVSEAHIRFNFNETDLVMVMYSTFYREDRWVNGKWRTGGNIYNNPYYDRDFITNHVDTTGFLIRDLALINSTCGFLNSLPCDSITMLSSDCKHELHLTEKDNEDTFKHVLHVYDPLLSNLPVPLFGSVVDTHNYPTVDYINNDNNPHKDPHPTADVYLDYLKLIGIPLTSNSSTYVDNVMEKMKLCKHHLDFTKVFVEEDKYTSTGASGIYMF